MNYYPFHIGDYAGHTRNLSLLEDLAYRRLLDAYYLAERPFNGSEADVAREIGMRDHLDEVSYVLRKFFVRDGDCWKNQRADEEIAAYRAKCEQASAAGKASAKARLNKRSTDVQPTNNQEPEPEPYSSLRSEKEKPRKRSSPPSVAKPADVTERTWADWLSLRKAKKAPVTGTVIEQAQREAEKAGMELEQFLRVWCARGSQGLQAEWLKPSEKAGGRAPPRVYHDLSGMDYTKGVTDDGRF